MIKGGDDMILEAVVTSAVVGGLFSQVNKSMEIDEKAMKKNIKAFTTMAEAEDKVERCQKNAIDKLVICAKRKNGILNCHIKMFKEQFEVIRKIEFRPGQGINELEKIDEINEQLIKCVSFPSISGKTERSGTQMLISFALFGIGGLMVKDSEMNLKLASRSVAQANAMAAQADSVCIALNGIAKHAEIITELLQKLGMMYIQSIKNITDILSKNGMNQDKYSKMDIDSINVSLTLTKLVYRIINTPLVDENGEIEKESVKVIEDGNRWLSSIGG